MNKTRAVTKRTILSRVADRVAEYKKQDAWWNPFTGFGDPNRDRSMSGIFVRSDRISDQELSDLYHGDDMAKRICRIVPRAMLRKGFVVDIPGNQEGSVAVAELLRKLKVAQKALEAMVWGRTFGGGVLLIGADDGLPADQPLDPNRIKSFTFLDVHDRRRFSRQRKNEDPKSPDYKKTETYLFNSIHGGSTVWHASRMIFFGGDHTGEQEKEELDGWDYSVLQTAYEPLRQFNSAHKGGELMIQEASQGVFKMRGLLGALAGNMADLMTRLQLLDMSKSVARSVFLDSEAGEEYTKLATQFSGVSDMLDRAALRLSAATEIPVTVLMGRSPAGLNATGESDVRLWYDSVATDQENELAPELLPLAHMAGKTLNIDTTGAKIKFPSLWAETPTEKAARRKTIAETDNIYLQAQVVMPEEVALSRFGEDCDEGEEGDITIDKTKRMVQVPPAPAPPPAQLPPPSGPSTIPAP